MTHLPPGTQRHQNLSCYSSDFDQTLKVGFWDQQQYHKQGQEQQQQAGIELGLNQAETVSLELAN